MTRWIETDVLANQNISSPLAIGSYTADGDRLIVCDISVDQVAGGGDYVVYITRQIAGAGSIYVVLPKTTLTAAAGETAISGQSGLISVRSGDVLTAYVDGLAGDTVTPDTTVRWFESGVLVTLADDAITAAKLAVDAITEIQNGLATSAEIAALNDPSAAEVADAVWDEAMAAHVVAGTTGEQLDSLCCSLGSGPIIFTYTVTDSVTLLPIEDVRVVVTTDAAGNTVVAEGYTNALGQVVFYLEAGNMYFWSFRSSYTFVNPDLENVA